MLAEFGDSMSLCSLKGLDGNFVGISSMLGYTRVKFSCQCSAISVLFFYAIVLVFFSFDFLGAFFSFLCFLGTGSLDLDLLFFFC